MPLEKPLNKEAWMAADLAQEKATSSFVLSEGGSWSLEFCVPLSYLLPFYLTNSWRTQNGLPCRNVY